MTEHVTLVEVGPRDGLQNEKTMVPTADKIALVDKLSGCGFTRIEATSFVSPKWVPQMADASEVMGGITRADGITYSALTPNMQGFIRAAEASADEVLIFAAATDGFSKANLNATTEEALERFRPVAQAAHDQGIPLRGSVSVVTDCPYDGAVDPALVARAARTLFDMGCHIVGLADTIGHGTPEKVAAMLDAALGEAEPSQYAGHFHDTNGRALDNIDVCLARGIRVFDASVGGLGMPYAPGAKGNVATEAVVALLADKGYETGIDRERLAEIASFAQGLRSAA